MDIEKIIKGGLVILGTAGVTEIIVDSWMQRKKNKDALRSIKNVEERTGEMSYLRPNYFLDSAHRQRVQDVIDYVRFESLKREREMRNLAYGARGRMEDNTERIKELEKEVKEGYERLLTVRIP
jgi:hypothetical protein